MSLKAAKKAIFHIKPSCEVKVTAKQIHIILGGLNASVLCKVNKHISPYGYEMRLLGNKKPIIVKNKNIFVDLSQNSDISFTLKK